MKIVQGVCYLVSPAVLVQYERGASHRLSSLCVESLGVSATFTDYKHLVYNGLRSSTTKSGAEKRKDQHRRFTRDRERARLRARADRVTSAVMRSFVCGKQHSEVQARSKHHTQNGAASVYYRRVQESWLMPSWTPMARSTALGTAAVAFALREPLTRFQQSTRASSMT